MRRAPLFAGSRLVLVPVQPDDVVVRPPPAPERGVDVAAAVRDALRFPLSGPPLEQVAVRGGSATVVVEPPALPVPGVQHDPRPQALAAALHELELVGVGPERVTILVAGGLARRVGAGELERVLPPPEARAFRGRVVVHDSESEDLVALTGEAQVHPALLNADLVLTVGAAETVLHGGPATLAKASDAATARRAVEASSLLEVGRAPGWELALELEAALAARVPVLGVSLVLDLPRATGALRGYPETPDALRRVERSWTRALFNRLPGALRRSVLDGRTRRTTATAVFAGAPSVAHAEALVRGIELRGAPVVEPVDALVVGVPWTGPHVPREPVNPVTAAAIGLGLAVRLHRDAFPVAKGGTVVLVHPLARSFGGGDGPYAAMLEGLRTVGGHHELDRLEAAAASDERARSAYRAGTACHPLLPYADWAGCRSVLEHVGRVVVAGCRDATAARALGLVPSHGIASALEMAHGVAGGRARVGVLLAPPYPALLVGERSQSSPR